MPRNSVGFSKIIMPIWLKRPTRWSAIEDSFKTGRLKLEQEPVSKAIDSANGFDLPMNVKEGCENAGTRLQ